MNILVTRHGQTNWNLENRVQGRTNINLNETGKKQAEEIRERINDRKVDVIFCSTLERAQETARIINEERNVEIKLDDRIIEMCYGELEERKVDECDFDDVWQINGDKVFEGAEKVEEVYKRVNDFVLYLKTLNYENVLIVTHNGVCRVINWYFNGAPENNNIRKIGIENCGLMEFEIESLML